MATATSHRIGRDEVVWAFGPNMEPVLEVEPGSMITIETNDCFTGQIQTEADLVTAIDFQRVRRNFRRSRAFPSPRCQQAPRPFA